jgi:hypothetical protein
MAPEQVRGDPVDPRTDVYALGVLLYHLSTGAYPVSPCPLPELFSRIRAGSLVPIRDARPDLPAEFVQVVTRALALEPERRFPTAGEMERALLAGLGTSAEPAGGAQQGVPASPVVARQGRAFRRRWLLAAALALASTLVLAFLVWMPSPVKGFRIEEASLYLGSRNEPLGEGEPIRMGDTVHLRFQADRDLHLYVLNEDAKGERYLLFPLAASRLRNPLRGRESHRLPGAIEGKEASWEVTSAGGTEWIIVVASPTPLPLLEALAPEALLPAAGVAVPYPRLPREAEGELLRGLGGLRLEKPATGEGGTLPLSRLVDELKDSGPSAGRSAGPWVRKFTLRNP